MKKMSKSYEQRLQVIKQEGYEAAKAGKPCDIPYQGLGERNAWLIGFRNFGIEQENKYIHAKTPFINAILGDDVRELLRAFIASPEVPEHVKRSFEKFDALPTPTTKGGFPIETG